MVFPPAPADTIPVVFSHPVLPATVRPRRSGSRGTRETVTPITGQLFAQPEFNERQTVVLHRLLGETTGTRAERRAVSDPGGRGAHASSPMMLVTPTGIVPAAGLGIGETTPGGNGPRMHGRQAQHLPSPGRAGYSQPNSHANSGEDLYGTSAKYRLQIYTSADFHRRHRRPAANRLRPVFRSRRGIRLAGWGWS